MDFDAGAANGGVEVGGGGVVAERDRQVLELLLERCGGVVTDSGDAASVEVDGGEGLEDIVELVGSEREVDGGVAADVPGVLEKAYAVFVEGNVGDR